MKPWCGAFFWSVHSGVSSDKTMSMRKIIVGAILIICELGIAGQLRPDTPSAEVLLAKASIPLRTAWENTRGWHARTQWVEGQLRVAASSEKIAREQLKDAGYMARTALVSPRHAGELIFTGRFRLKSLPKITGLDSVRYIEAAVPLHTKSAE